MPIELKIILTFVLLMVVSFGVFLASLAVGGAGFVRLVTVAVLSGLPLAGSALLQVIWI